jgi:putative transposase
VNRLSELIPETKTDCFAWTILENHPHFLFRTGAVAVSVFMSRLLAGYAGWFNKKYRRPAVSRLWRRGEQIANECGVHLTGG